MRNHSRSITLAGLVLGLMLSTVMIVGAGRADAAQISPATRPVSTVRVTHTERDNGARLMWGLNNGAAYVTSRPAACRLENRPGMCWQAYQRQALTLDRAHRAAYVRQLSRHMAPCPQEDSRNCRWNGHTAGNGHGRSFADLAGMTFYFNGQVIRYV